MANSYFRFKQFTIHQDKCAMKVCTDACLFGALLPMPIGENVLDIGTGTGLLSLFFAQKNASNIDAIEIDLATFEQATQNINCTIWKNNITTYCTDIKTFYPNKKYNLIFSNPPFYTNDLKSIDDKRNVAMHTSLLSYNDLLASVSRLIDIDGAFVTLLPFIAENSFLNIAKTYNLYPSHIIRIKQTDKHSFFRTVVYFSFNEGNIIQEEITIKINQQYSSEFAALLKDYYLFL